DEAGGNHFGEPTRRPECDVVTLTLVRSRDAAQNLMQAAIVGHDRARRWRRSFRFELGEQPSGPKREWTLAQQPPAGRRGPDAIATFGLDIDAEDDLAGATAQPLRMRKDEMQAPAGRPMRPCRQQPATTSRKPLPRCSVLSVDIENVDAGGFAGADTDQRAAV